MTDGLTTPRFALPLLATAQAQKEVTHNEALVLLDALAHTNVVAGPQPTPPVSPTVGDCWLIGATPTGAWSGRGPDIAVWTDGGWRYISARDGMEIRRLSDGARLRFAGGGWTAPANVAAPTGGSLVDSEARLAIAALISALCAHGLLLAG